MGFFCVSAAWALCSIRDVALLLLLHSLLFGSDCIQAVNSSRVCSALVLQLCVICVQVLCVPVAARCTARPDALQQLHVNGLDVVPQVLQLSPEQRVKAPAHPDTRTKLNFKSWFKNTIVHRDKMSWNGSGCCWGAVLWFSCCCFCFSGQPQVVLEPNRG